MAILPASDFPGAQKDPLAYPGRRPSFSYVYYQSKIYKIVSRGATLNDLWVEHDAALVTLDTFLTERQSASLSERQPVLAVGSNGCPGRLAEKYGHEHNAAIPVFVGTMPDIAVVYSRRLVQSYGALPATYLCQPGAVSWLSVTMLSDEQLRRMDKSERIGESYTRVAVPGQFQMEGGPEISDLSAYLDRKILSFQNKPVRLRLLARTGPDWPKMDEREVLALIFDQAGLLPGESVETRHQRLLDDARIRRQLVSYLETEMGGLEVDDRGRLVGELQRE